MKILIAAVAVGGLLASANAPVYAGPASTGLNPATAQQFGQDGLVQKTGRRGRRLATGLAIGLGVLGVIAASRARAHGHIDYEVEIDDHEYRHIRRWRRRCVDGFDRACFKFEDRC